MNDDLQLAHTVKILAHQFFRFMNAKKAEVSAKVKEMPSLTETQGRIIDYLFQRKGVDPIYQKDLEKQFNIRRSTATVILKRMEKAGFVIRRVSHDDARMKALILTEKAKRTHPLVKAEILKAEEQAKSGLTQEEVDAFLRIANKIIENIS